VESSRLFTASLSVHVKEKASKVGTKHTGLGEGGGGVIAQSEHEKEDLLGSSCYHLVTNSSAN